MSTPRCSPGLFPREGIRYKVPESERRVFSALNGSLPAGWYAWHSMKLCAEEQDYAEADFVIASPAQGILILEVKGGSIRKENGVWFQNERVMLRSPLDQAHRFRKILQNRFSELRMPCPSIGLAICFPDTPVDSGLTQDDLVGKVIGSESTPFLDRILPDLFERIVPDRRDTQKGWIAALHQMWCESWIPDRKLTRRKAEDDEVRLKLDQEQMKILDLAGENNRVIIQGMPGTGKSILAMELARREAAKGRRVLILCFTESLGLELSRCLQDPLIKATSIGSLALALLRGQGKEIIEEYTPDFWEPVMLEAAGVVLPEIETRWDTVIVDEAQDMGENAWSFIEACAGAQSRLWIFTDPSQTALPNRFIPHELENSCTKLRLDRRYRCPPAVQALAAVFVGERPDLALIQEGISSGIIKIVGGVNDNIDRLIGLEIRSLLREGFSRSEIAILSLRGLTCQDNVVHRPRVGGEIVFRASDPASAGKLICDTFIRFKGLERPAILVTDLRYVTNRLLSRLLIAVTRATSVLRVIDEREALLKVPIFQSLSFPTLESK